MRFGFRIKSATIYLFLYFFLLGLVGSLLLKAPFFYADARSVPYVDALFTTVSAICVTGLSTLSMDAFSTAGFVLILFLIEAGGFGLVSFFTIYLVFSAKKISLLNRNIIHEYFTEDSQLEVRGILRRILTVTLLFQAVGAVFLCVILKISGEENFLFYGIFLSVSAFCNAGFSPYSDSLAGFSDNVPFCLVICVLIIAGGLGFFVISELWEVFFLKRKKTLSLHSKIVIFFTAILIFGGAGVIFIAEYSAAFEGMGLVSKINNAFFESITFRTAGFETIPQKNFSSVTDFISFVLMLTGGSPGSMAGGLKTTTIFLVIYYAYRNSMDKGNPTVFKRDISDASFQKAVRVCVKGLCLVSMMFLALLFAEKTSLENGIFSTGDLFFEAVSAFGTVGLSKGLTGCLSAPGKLVIILMMFAGRTGITFITINGLSGRKSIKALTDYPKEDVLVG